MRGRFLLGLALLAMALPASAQAQGALAFVSARCDDGGVPTTGSHFGPGERGCTPGIFVMDDDGSNQRRLTKGFSEGEEPRSGDLDPSWSPAGDRIVFTRHLAAESGQPRLFVMNADGSDQRQLIPGGVPGVAGERQPHWSRTGDLITFQTFGPDFGSIWVVRPDGSGLRRVSPEGQTALSPAFAPDGIHIVYIGYVMNPGVPLDYGMWVTDRFGTTPRRITAGDLPISSSGGSFSPSGLYLAITLWIDHKPMIHAMRTDGTVVRRVDGAVGYVPTWSGLGNAIFYTHGEGSDALGIYRLDLQPGSSPKRLTPPGSGGGRAEWSALGRLTTALPSADELAPLTIVEHPPGPPEPGRYRGPATSKIPYLAADISGVRRVDAAVGLRMSKRECRFLRTDGRLGPRRRCSDPVYGRAPLDGPGWRKRTKRLPKGTYEVRLKATDRRGNTTRKPKRRVIEVR